MECVLIWGKGCACCAIIGGRQWGRRSASKSKLKDIAGTNRKRSPTKGGFEQVAAVVDDATDNEDDEQLLDALSKYDDASSTLSFASEMPVMPESPAKGKRLPGAALDQECASERV